MDDYAAKLRRNPW